jgi:peptide/nickel transport system permease protein
MSGVRRVILTRVAAAVPLLLGVSLVSFLLLQLAPGSFIDRLRIDPGIPEQTLELLSSRYGLDRPWYAQYLSWLGGVLKGDLGFSLAFQRPVAEMLGDSALYTAALALSAGVVSFLAGLALALLVATRPGGVSDRLLSASALAMISVPTLVLAVAALGFAASTGVFPIGGGSAEVGLTWWHRTADFAWHLVLPGLVLSTALTPLSFLQARGALLETFPSSFARAAQARGLSATRVLFRHRFKVALVPVLTYAGSSVGRVLNGAFLVEVVTGWPGMGRLAWSALLSRDSFLILGVLTVAALLMLLGNLAADLAVAAVDPRIRLEGE